MEKKYSGYLVVDWRRDTIRFRASFPKLEPYEIGIRIAFKVIVPQVKPLEVELGTVEVPEAIAEIAGFEHICPEEE